MAMQELTPAQHHALTLVAVAAAQATATDFSRYVSVNHLTTEEIVEAKLLQDRLARAISAYPHVLLQLAEGLPPA